MPTKASNIFNIISVSNCTKCLVLPECYFPVCFGLWAIAYEWSVCFFSVQIITDGGKSVVFGDFDEIWKMQRKIAFSAIRLVSILDNQRTKDGKLSLFTSNHYKISRLKSVKSTLCKLNYVVSWSIVVLVHRWGIYLCWLDSFDCHEVVFCNINNACRDIFHHTTINFIY